MAKISPSRFESIQVDLIHPEYQTQGLENRRKYEKVNNREWKAEQQFKPINRRLHVNHQGNLKHSPNRDCSQNQTLYQSLLLA
jgi:hypothetical protein